ncbi:MAG: histidine phosphatase family protein, partial [Terriglobales bacterium]
HYGGATYMTKKELFERYPENKQVRIETKHLWKPHEGGESLVDMIAGRVSSFVNKVKREIDSGLSVVAITHHTTIMALRTVLERRAPEEVIADTRERKVPNGGILVYRKLDTGSLSLVETISPPVD